MGPLNYVGRTWDGIVGFISVNKFCVSRPEDWWDCGADDECRCCHRGRVCMRYDHVCSYRDIAHLIISGCRNQVIGAIGVSYFCTLVLVPVYECDFAFVSLCVRECVCEFAG